MFKKTVVIPFGKDDYFAPNIGIQKFALSKYFTKMN
jgi:hypothetical protein